MTVTFTFSPMPGRTRLTPLERPVTFAIVPLISIGPSRTTPNGGLASSGRPSPPPPSSDRRPLAISIARRATPARTSAAIKIGIAAGVGRARSLRIRAMMPPALTATTVLRTKVIGHPSCSTAAARCRFPSPSLSLPFARWALSIRIECPNVIRNFSEYLFSSLDRLSSAIHGPHSLPPRRDSQQPAGDQEVPFLDQARAVRGPRHPARAPTCDRAGGALQRDIGAGRSAEGDARRGGPEDRRGRATDGARDGALGRLREHGAAAARARVRREIDQGASRRHHGEMGKAGRWQTGRRHLPPAARGVGGLRAVRQGLPATRGRTAQSPQRRDGA